MRIDPVNQDKTDPYAHLAPLDKVMRRIAIFVAFAGVFKWFMDVVFG